MFEILHGKWLCLQISLNGHKVNVFTMASVVRLEKKKKHAHYKPWLTNPLQSRPFSTKISWSLGNVPSPASWRGLGQVARRHVWYPEPIQKQHADALYICQEPNLSQFYKSHSSEVVKPKAVLPVCFIHLYASAQCYSHRSTCSYVTFTCLGAALSHISKCFVWGAYNVEMAFQHHLKELVNKFKIYVSWTQICSKCKLLRMLDEWTYSPYKHIYVYI